MKREEAATLECIGGSWHGTWVAPVRGRRRVELLSKDDPSRIETYERTSMPGGRVVLVKRK